MDIFSKLVENFFWLKNVLDMLFERQYTDKFIENHTQNLLAVQQVYIFQFLMHISTVSGNHYSQLQGIIFLVLVFLLQEQIVPHYKNLKVELRNIDLLLYITKSIHICYDSLCHLFFKEVLHSSYNAFECLALSYKDVSLVKCLNISLYVSDSSCGINCVYKISYTFHV